jgi:Transposase DDE domain group 1
MIRFRCLRFQPSRARKSQPRSTVGAWPATRILLRGDGHYARPEAMTWCEDNDVDYVFGLPGTKPLSRKVDDTADAVRSERALADLDVVRGFAETRYRAGSWGASSSPISITARPNGCTRPSTAPADRRKISSSCTRPSSPQIVRPAGQPAPTRFASSSTPPPSG